MWKRILSVVAIGVGLLLPSLAAAQNGPWPSEAYRMPSYEANTAPVLVEPYTSSPWTNGEVEIPVDHSPRFLGGYDYPVEESAARRDLGNLIPPGSRSGFFQKIHFGVTSMPRFQSDGLGMTEVKTNVVTAVPFLQRHQPLTITPEYTARFLEGPDFIDVPSRLHDIELKLNHLRRLSDRWILNAAVTLGTYGDDRSLDASDAFRVSGRAVGIYESSPETKWIVGVAYLNRAGVSVVPVVGWTYTTDDLRYELIFPQPRVAWRTWSQGAPGYDERWWYVAAEFGGGIWAVQRASGADDNLSYSDYRLLVGTERKQIGGLSHRWEFGYIFGRELEYDSVATDIEIDDTVFVRAVFAY